MNDEEQKEQSKTAPQPSTASPTLLIYHCQYCGRENTERLEAAPPASGGMMTEKQVEELRWLANSNFELTRRVGGLVYTVKLAALADAALSLREQREGIRDEVVWFARAMEAKLKANDHKHHWHGAEMNYLSVRLTQERKELSAAIASRDPERILNEAADIANFCMMIADNARRAAAPSAGRGEGE